MQTSASVYTITCIINLNYTLQINLVNLVKTMFNRSLYNIVQWNLLGCIWVAYAVPDAV